MDARLHLELLLHSNVDCAQFCPVEWTKGGVGAGAGDDGGGGEGASSSAAAADWLAVATYELDEPTRTRTGSLMLYTLGEEEEEDEEEGEQQPQEWRPRRRRLALSARRAALPGVFDAQWLRLDEPAAAGWGSSGAAPAAEWGVSLALSDGRVVVLAVVAKEEEEQEEQEEEARGASGEQGGGACRRRRCPIKLDLEQVAEWQAIRGPDECGDDATKRMALMVAWDRRPGGRRAAASGSGGTVAVMEQHQPAAAAAAAAASGGGDGGNGGDRAWWSEWQAHDLEAWSVAFDPWRPPALYSGSDDASLKLWDLRMARRSSGGSGSGAPPATPALLLCDKRTHAAGVTCISPHPSREHILATGSYDEKARLWDARRPRCPLAEVDVGGGAWRLQWRPAGAAVRGGGEGGADDDSDLILAACMYNGFAVLRATGLGGAGGEAAHLEVAERMAQPHDSIAYGCDWWRRGARVRGGGGGGAFDADVVATASFYDRRLCLWRPQTTSTEASNH